MLVQPRRKLDEPVMKSWTPEIPAVSFESEAEQISSEIFEKQSCIVRVRKPKERKDASAANTSSISSVQLRIKSMKQMF